MSLQMHAHLEETITVYSQQLPQEICYPVHNLSKAILLPGYTLPSMHNLAQQSEVLAVSLV